MGEAKRRRIFGLRTARCAPSPPSAVWMNGYRVRDRDHSMCAVPAMQLVVCRPRPATVAEYLAMLARAQEEEAERERARQAAIEARREEQARIDAAREAAIARGEPAPTEPRPRRPPIRAAMLLAMVTGLAAGTGMLDIMPIPKRRRGDDDDDR